jgi:hypothetical protein
MILKLFKLKLRQRAVILWFSSLSKHVKANLLSLFEDLPNNFLGNLNFEDSSQSKKCFKT